MHRVTCLVALLLLVLTGYSQMRNKKAVKYFNEGCNKVFRKDYSGAVKDFSEALKLDPAFLEAWENRGVAKYYLKDLRGAVEDYTKALLINPNDHNTYGRRGYAEFNLQDYRAAISDFSRAIKGNSDDIQYYQKRGESKHLIRDYEGAVADFDQVITSWSANKYQKSKAYYRRGLIKIDIGQKDSGCADFVKARQLGFEEADLVIQAFCMQ